MKDGYCSSEPQVRLISELVFEFFLNEMIFWKYKKTPKQNQLLNWNSA